MMKSYLDEAIARTKRGVSIVHASRWWLVTGPGVQALFTSRDDAKRTYCNLIAEKAGVTALEYALIASLVAVVIIGSVSLLGQSVSSTFSTIANSI